MLGGSEISLREALTCFDNFNSLSGLKINQSKTQAVWVGNKKYSDLILCTESHLNWSHSNFRVLGLEFCLDLQKIMDINFCKKDKRGLCVVKSW